MKRLVTFMLLAVVIVSPAQAQRKPLVEQDVALQRGSLQGLIRHFRPELERRIHEHNAQFAPEVREAAE